MGLLALLATSRTRSLSRERLSALLWPDRDAEPARHLLREAAYRLREALGDSALTGQGDELRLDPAAVRCDVWEFEAAVAQRDWAAADRLYTGAFLDGVSLGDSPDVEHWLDAERARLADLHAQSLESLAAERAGAGDWLSAVTLWKRRAAADPYNSRIAARLMEALDAAGDRAGALRHAARHTELLQSELDAAPDPAVAALAEGLRREPVRLEIPGLSGTGKFRLPAALPNPAPSSDSAAPGFQKPRRRVGYAGLAAVSTLAILIVGFARLRLESAPSGSLVESKVLQPLPRLMLTDFTVKGADSALAFPLGEAVRMSLNQSSAFSVLGTGAIPGALLRLRRPPDSRVNVALAREIAEREGVAAIVDGEVLRDSLGLGSRFLITLRLVSADSGNLLASVSKTAAGPDDLIAAVDAVGRKLRARIGESAKSLRATPPLYRITTSSITALRLATQGTRYNNQTRFLEAVPLLRQAVAIDSGFAEAWRMLAVLMLNARVFPKSAIDSALTMAYRNRDRTTDRERNQLEAFYLIAGPHADRGRAAEALERIVAGGDQSGPVVNLVGLYVGRREWSRAESLIASRLRGRSGIGPNMLSNVITALLAQGKLPQAEELLATVGGRLPENSRVVMEGLRLQYYRGELKEFKRGLQQARLSEDPDLRLRANEAAFHLARLEGRFREAEQRWAEARAIEVARGFVRPPLEDSVQAADFDVRLRQQPSRAIARLDAALAAYPLRRLHPSDRPYVRLATAYAIASRPDKARSLLTQLADLRDTALARIQQPQIHQALAEIALAEHRSRDAVREFQSGYQLPDGPVGDPLAEVADVARAFDQAGEPDSAIALFEEYLRRPSGNRLPADGSYRPMVHQRLGELYEAKHEFVLAERHYREFVELWHDADAHQQPRLAAVKLRLAAMAGKAAQLAVRRSP